jgi:hypothetical protein
MKKDQRLYDINLSALPPGRAHQHMEQCGTAMAITRHPYPAENLLRDCELKVSLAISSRLLLGVRATDCGVCHG